MTDKIELDISYFEHLLNCLANQKFLFEMKEEDRKDSQSVIDKAWNDGMSILSPILAKKSLIEESHRKYVEKWNEDIDNGLLNSLLDESKSITNSKNVYFKWSQLVQQECYMYAMLGEQVCKEEFDSLCQRRGFDIHMIRYLRDVIKHIGLGNKIDIASTSTECASISTECVCP